MRRRYDRALAALPERSSVVKFNSKVLLGGRTATGIVVPADAVAALGKSRKPAVAVSINGHTYRSTVAVRGGEFMLPLSAENRTAGGVGADDEVEVELQLDTAPREVILPPDFAAGARG